MNLNDRAAHARSPWLACLLIASTCMGCDQAAEAAARSELIVYAAASTKDALHELEALYERQQPVDLVFNLGSSGDLSRQIVAAAKADLFLSADDKELDRVEQAGLVEPGSRVALLSNQLVVIESAGGPTLFHEPFDPSQLAQPAIEWISLAHVETVPAGRYAKAWLESLSVWAPIQERILPGVDVRAALAAVESGGARVGIVYRSDAMRSTKVRIVHLVPLESGPRISYPLAVIAARPAREEALRFAAFLKSPPAAAIWERHGFLAVPDGPLEARR